jgi:hypothetical protein
MHYARWQTVGNAGGASPTENHWYIGRACKTLGCQVASTDMGWCRIHYELWLDDTASRPRCRIPECDRPARARGVCLRHYTNQRYHAARDLQVAGEIIDASLRKSKPCNEPGCDGRRSEFGFCTQHYAQWLKTTADLERCSFKGCERPRQVRGMCSKHEQHVRYYQGAAGASVAGMDLGTPTLIGSLAVNKDAP